MNNISKFLTRSFMGTLLAVVASGCDKAIESSETQKLSENCPEMSQRPLVVVPAKEMPVFYQKDDAANITIVGNQILGEMNDSVNATVQPLIADILQSAALKDAEKLDLGIIFSSIGGNANFGFALQSAFKHYGSDKVFVQITADASSAATIALSGAGTVFAPQDIELMTHAARIDLPKINPVTGKPYLSEYKVGIDQSVSRTNDRMRAVFKAKTGLGEQCLKHLTRSNVDTNFTTVQAVRLGFVDVMQTSNAQWVIRKKDMKKFSFTTNEAKPYQP